MLSFSTFIGANETAIYTRYTKNMTVPTLVATITETVIETHIVTTTVTETHQIIKAQNLPSHSHSGICECWVWSVRRGDEWGSHKPPVEDSVHDRGNVHRIQDSKPYNGHKVGLR